MAHAAQRSPKIKMESSGFDKLEVISNGGEGEAHAWMWGKTLRRS